MSRETVDSFREPDVKSEGWITSGLSRLPSCHYPLPEVGGSLNDLVQQWLYRPETLLNIERHRTAFDVVYGAEALVIKLAS